MDRNDLNEGTPANNNNSFGSSQDNNPNLGSISSHVPDITPDANDKPQKVLPTESIGPEIYSSPLDLEIWQPIPQESRISNEADLASYYRDSNLIPESIPVNSPFLDQFGPKIRARLKRGPGSAKSDDSDLRAIIFGMEKVFAASIKHRHLLSVSCYLIKEKLKLTNKDLAELITKSMNEEYSEAWVSRLVRAGKVIVTYKEAREVRSQEVLNFVLRLKEDECAEVFRTGRVNGRVDIRTGKREDIAAEINLLAKGKPRPEVAAFTAVGQLFMQIIETTAALVTMDGDGKLQEVHDIVFDPMKAIGKLAFQWLEHHEGAALEVHVVKRKRAKENLDKVSSAVVDNQYSGDLANLPSNIILENACWHILGLTSLVRKGVSR